jgi:hypothetical protein
MSPVDEKAAKLVPTERPSAGAVADKLDEQLRVSVDALRHLSPPPTPELDDLLSAISHHLDGEASERKAIRHRLLAIENEIERLAPGGFARYLVATGFVVAAILAWQSYGEAAKQIIATRVPELGWSPQTKQAKPPVVESKAAPATRTAPETVAPKTPAATSVDPVQVQQMVQSLSALRESVQQLASRQQSLAALAQTLATGQDQMVHQIDMLQSANQEILEKIPAPPPPPPSATARKPTPVHPARKLAPTPFWAAPGR